GRPEREQTCSARERYWTASAYSRARNEMNGTRRKLEMCGAMIGGEFNRNAALGKYGCQCFGWKQMAAGPTGREQDERRAARAHQILLPATAGSGEIIAARGCSRVNASNMPIA